MRNYLAPLTIALTVGFAGVAAADTVTGTIAEVSELSGDITLSNGQEFEFDRDHALRGFNVGNEVTIRFVTVGDEQQPLSITPVDY